jgi:Holliday junction resolvase RusA-like endonuclease
LVNLLPFEFVINHKPVSLQTKKRNKLQEWKSLVRREVERLWAFSPIEEQELHVVIVHLSDDSPADVDNIIKPILDALVGLVYVDDILIADVESHRRYLSDKIEVTNLPLLLQSAVLANEECIYVKIAISHALGDYL